jgi:hypothetical protein
MEMTFMEKTITRQKIIDALQEFASQYPNAETYDDWLQKGTYK